MVTFDVKLHNNSDSSITQESKDWFKQYVGDGDLIVTAKEAENFFNQIDGLDDDAKSTLLAKFNKRSQAASQSTSYQKDKIEKLGNAPDGENFLTAHTFMTWLNNNGDSDRLNLSHNDVFSFVGKTPPQQVNTQQEILAHRQSTGTPVSPPPVSSDTDPEFIPETIDISPPLPTGTPIPRGSAPRYENTAAQWAETLKPIVDNGGTFIVDWDNTIDFDTEHSIDDKTIEWLKAFANSGVKTTIVTANAPEAKTHHINALRTLKDNGDLTDKEYNYWVKVLNDGYYDYGYHARNPNDKGVAYRNIIGNQDPKKFFLLDDSPKNVDEWIEVVGEDAGYFRPENRQINGETRNFVQGDHLFDAIYDRYFPRLSETVPDRPISDDRLTTRSAQRTARSKRSTTSHNVPRLPQTVIEHRQSGAPNTFAVPRQRNKIATSNWHTVNLPNGEIQVQYWNLPKPNHFDKSHPGVSTRIPAGTAKYVAITVSAGREHNEIKDPYKHFGEGNLVGFAGDSDKAIALYRLDEDLVIEELGPSAQLLLIDTDKELVILNNGAPAIDDELVGRSIPHRRVEASNEPNSFFTLYADDEGNKPSGKPGLTRNEAFALHSKISYGRTGPNGDDDTLHLKEPGETYEKDGKVIGDRRPNKGEGTGNGNGAILQIGFA